MAQILVVEDNALNLKLVTIILQAEGHTVRSATDAVETERAIAAESPDLILMDLGLPGTDGYTLTRELRSRSATRSTPILAVTSFAMTGDRERALQAGCTEYLTKPIDRKGLVETVRLLLATRGGTLKGGKG